MVNFSKLPTFTIPGRSKEEIRNVWFNVETISTDSLKYLTAIWIFVLLSYTTVTLTANLQYDCFAFCALDQSRQCSLFGVATAAHCIDFNSTLWESSDDLHTASDHIFRKSRRVIYSEPGYEIDNETVKAFDGALFLFYRNSSSNEILAEYPANITYGGEFLSMLIADEFEIPAAANRVAIQLQKPIPRNYINITSLYDTNGSDNATAEYFIPLRFGTTPTLTWMTLAPKYVTSEVVLRYLCLVSCIVSLILFIFGHATRDQVTIRLQDFALKAFVKEYVVVIILHVAVMIFCDPLIYPRYAFPYNGFLQYWSEHFVYLLLASACIFMATFISFSLNDIGREWKKLLKTRAIVISLFFVAWFITLDSLAYTRGLTVSAILFGFSLGGGFDLTFEQRVIGLVFLGIGCLWVVCLLFLFRRNKERIFYNKGFPTYRGKIRLRVLAIRMISTFITSFAIFYFGVAIPIQVTLSKFTPIVGRTAIGDVFCATTITNIALWLFSVKSHRAHVAPESPFVHDMTNYYTGKDDERQILEKEELIVPTTISNDEVEDENNNNNMFYGETTVTSQEEEGQQQENQQPNTKNQSPSPENNNNGVVFPASPSVNSIASSSNNNPEGVATSVFLTTSKQQNLIAASIKRKKFEAAIGTARLRKYDAFTKELIPHYKTSSIVDYDNISIEKWTEKNFDFLVENCSTGFFFTTEAEKIEFDDAHAMMPNARSFFCFETANRMLSLSNEVYFKAPEDLLDMYEDAELGCCQDKLMNYLDDLLMCGGNQQEEDADAPPADLQKKEKEEEEMKEKEKDNHNNNDDEDNFSYDARTLDSKLDIEPYGYSLLKCMQVNGVQILIALYAPQDAVGPTMFSRPSRWAPDAAPRTKGRSIDETMFKGPSQVYSSHRASKKDLFKKFSEKVWSKFSSSKTETTTTMSEEEKESTTASILKKLGLKSLFSAASTTSNSHSSSQKRSATTPPRLFKNQLDNNDDEQNNNNNNTENQTTINSPQQQKHQSSSKMQMDQNSHQDPIIPPPLSQVKSSSSASPNRSDRNNNNVKKNNVESKNGVLNSSSNHIVIDISAENRGENNNNNNSKEKDDQEKKEGKPPGHRRRDTGSNTDHVYFDDAVRRFSEKRHQKTNSTTISATNKQQQRRPSSSPPLNASKPSAISLADEEKMKEDEEGKSKNNNNNMTTTPSVSVVSFDLASTTNENSFATTTNTSTQPQQQQQPTIVDPKHIAHLAVCFRGTTTGRNHATNLDFGRAIFREMAAASRGQAMVHHGFNETWNAVQPHVFEYLDKYLTQLQHRKFPVVFSGHSSGGAMACLCAYAFRREFPSHPCSVYTFGQTRFANAAFRDLFNKAVPDCYRVVLENDFVVHLNHCGRVHVGKEVVVDRDGNFIVEPNGIENFYKVLRGVGSGLGNHRLARYAKAFEKLFTTSLPLPFKTFLAVQRQQRQLLKQQLHAPNLAIVAQGLLSGGGAAATTNNNKQSVVLDVVGSSNSATLKRVGSRTASNLNNESFGNGGAVAVVTTAGSGDFGLANSVVIENQNESNSSPSGYTSPNPFVNFNSGSNGSNNNNTTNNFSASRYQARLGISGATVSPQNTGIVFSGSMALPPVTTVDESQQPHHRPNRLSKSFDGQNNINLQSTGTSNSNVETPSREQQQQQDNQNNKISNHHNDPFAEAELQETTTTNKKKNDNKKKNIKNEPIADAVILSASSSVEIAPPKRQRTSTVGPDSSNYFIPKNATSKKSISDSRASSVLSLDNNNDDDDEIRPLQTEDDDEGTHVPPNVVTSTFAENSKRSFVDDDDDKENGKLSDDEVSPEKQ